MIIDRPIPFSGTPEQARLNFLTHDWFYDGDIEVCMNCDSKSWHKAASYPCGQNPPREIVEV
jgi:hypothetical protein